MVDFSAKALRTAGCLLVLLAAAPAGAAPFFVKVYGRTYKIDPRSPEDQPKDPKPEELMKALPPDLTNAPGFRPSNEQVLAEVEERVWIAQSQLGAGLARTASTGELRKKEAYAKATEPEITGSLVTGALQTPVPGLQNLYDRYLALNLLARELRRSLDLPVKQPEAGFSRPKLSPEIEASYRAMGFDALEAYYGFRRVKAAFRSGDVELISQVTHYPLLLTGRVRRTIHDREQLVTVKAKALVLNPGIREQVGKSDFETVFVRDKGMLVGDGAVWITHDKTGFGLGAIELE